MDLRDFKLTTDYPIEKVIAYKQGSFDVSFFISFTVEHGLTFAPLPYFQWSLTPDFLEPREVTQGPGDLYTTTDPFVTAAFANSNSFIFDFFMDSTYTSSPKTIYYRMYGLLPTNIIGQTAAPTSGLDGLFEFSLNTDLNYLRVYMQDRVSANPSFPVQHNLGFRPTVMAWQEINDPTHGFVITPTRNNVIYDASGFAPPAPALVGTNELLLTRTSSTSETNFFHYRIYV